MKKSWFMTCALSFSRLEIEPVLHWAHPISTNRHKTEYSSGNAAVAQLN
jgi:hypothetical protein